MAGVEHTPQAVSDGYLSLESVYKSQEALVQTMDLDNFEYELKAFHDAITSHDEELNALENRSEKRSLRILRNRVVKMAITQQKKCWRDALDLEIAVFDREYGSGEPNQAIIEPLSKASRNIFRRINASPLTDDLKAFFVGRLKTALSRALLFNCSDEIGLALHADMQTQLAYRQADIKLTLEKLSDIQRLANVSHSGELAVDYPAQQIQVLDEQLVGFSSYTLAHQLIYFTGTGTSCKYTLFDQYKDVLAAFVENDSNRVVLAKRFAHRVDELIAETKMTQGRLKALPVAPIVSLESVSLTGEPELPALLQAKDQIEKAVCTFEAELSEICGFGRVGCYEAYPIYTQVMNNIALREVEAIRVVPTKADGVIRQVSVAAPYAAAATGATKKTAWQSFKSAWNSFWSGVARLFSCASSKRAVAAARVQTPVADGYMTQGQARAEALATFRL